MIKIINFKLEFVTFENDHNVISADGIYPERMLPLLTIKNDSTYVFLTMGSDTLMKIFLMMRQQKQSWNYQLNLYD